MFTCHSGMSLGNPFCHSLPKLLLNFQRKDVAGYQSRALGISLTPSPNRKQSGLTSAGGRPLLRTTFSFFTSTSCLPAALLALLIFAVIRHIFFIFFRRKHPHGCAKVPIDDTKGSRTLP